MMKSKVRGNCEICKTSIVLGELTLSKDGRYLCALCQIDLNKGIEFRNILVKRRLEILEQLHEIDEELNVENRIEVT